MKFSFVVPAYNEEKYLEKCLKSIKSQTYKDYEIIVSYSPSGDRTLQIAKKYGARIVKLPKCHPGKARNAGVKAAVGEYLVLSDADVVLPPDFLEHTVRYLERGYLVVGYKFEWLESIKGLEASNIMTNMLAKNWKMFFFCYTIKKSLFEKIGGFDESLEVNEDWDISKRIRRNKMVKFSDKVIIRVSARRFSKMGKMRTALMYAKWTLFGYMMGKKVKYVHVSDIGTEKPNRGS
ncbi:MAG: glycosyltransferase [Candidatus Aenigmarchaeota archaeon]|nr:glycosyltransferase [Candidatus Aenigmarchaeota archaeon]